MRKLADLRMFVLLPLLFFAALAGAEPLVAYKSALAGISLFAEIPLFSKGEFDFPLADKESSFRLGLLFRNAGGDPGSDPWSPTLPNVLVLGAWTELRQTLAGARSRNPLLLDVGVRQRSAMILPPLEADAMGETKLSAPSHEHGVGAFAELRYRDRPYYENLGLSLEAQGGGLVGSTLPGDFWAFASWGGKASFRIPLVPDYLGLAGSARIGGEEDLLGRGLPSHHRAGASSRGLAAIWGRMAAQASVEMRSRFWKAEIPYLADMELVSFADASQVDSLSQMHTRLTVGGELASTIYSPYDEHPPALSLSVGLALNCSGVMGPGGLSFGPPLPYLCLRADAAFAAMLVALAASFI